MAARIALPVLACALAYRRVDPAGSWLEALAWSAPAAVGLSSVVLWGLMWMPLDSWQALRGADLVVWSAALAAAIRWRRIRDTGQEPVHPGAPESSPGKRGGRGTASAVLLAILPLALSLTAESFVMPHGQWDAWAVWNLRARFLYRGYPDQWRDGFSSLLAWSHVDYPLLLPLSVVRGWMVAGRETTAVPSALAALFALCTPLVAAAAVRRVHSAGRAVVTALAIVACPAFVRYAAAQCADVPLGFFVLATSVALFRACAPSGARAWWGVAGVAAGLAAWTKNEGILFLLLALGAVVTAAARRRGAAGTGAWHTWPPALFLAGAAPAIAALAVLKSITPANDLLGAQSAVWVLEAVGSPQRVAIVASAFGRALWHGGATGPGVLPAMAAFVAVSGAARPSNPVPLGAIAGMALLLGAYAVACLLSPHDLAWQLAVSVDRLVLHAFPTLVWAGFMTTKP